MKHERPSRKTSANLTINASLIEDAKALGINLSQAAEAGLAEAVAREKAERWKRENAGAIKQYNDWIADEGLPLRKFRTF